MRLNIPNAVSPTFRLESLSNNDNRTSKDLRRTQASGYRGASVKDEMRANLICKLKRREKLFPGIVGYDETVVPQLVNAILSRHNLILLGLRGQAKSRIIRQLTNLLDEQIPIIAGSEVNDDPFNRSARTAVRRSSCTATQRRSIGSIATRALSKSWRRPT